VVVVGSTGSGKTTLARRIAAAFAIPHVELDAINWRPGWRSLSRDDPNAFIAEVTAAAAGPSWVIEGGYRIVREAIWARAQHLVWLDYGPQVIMPRVIWRSLVRAASRRPMWNGNREEFARWLRPDHPIRWAWDTWADRRATFAELAARPDFAHLTVHRLRRPSQARGVVDALGG
jgi:adenylate kinase family enzyme